jgi:septal ring factor EnvC (AmiA/AmiB activator)
MTHQKKKKKWDKFELDGVTPHVCHKQEQQQQQQQQQHLDDLSKEIMTIKGQLLAVVNRLDHVEKKLMMK